MTQRELFLLIFGIVIYIVLFYVTVQNSRRKILALQTRLDKVRAMQEQYDIEANEQKISELENLIKKLGDENSMLRLELEEKKATLDYNNKQECLNTGKSLSYQDWGELTQLINSIYTNFTEKLYSLYHMSEHECHVSLLTKIHLQPKDIALLTAHSKESIATTRSRLYSKVFGRKGSSKDWDDFILTL